jgi:phosphatidylglycerol---prolipoprotein diacylglyceryl transferase
LLTFPEIDPIALQIGFIKIRWYGLMYVIGFFSAWGLALFRAKRRDDLTYSREDIDSLIFYLAVGLILGARVGYVLFYNFGLFMRDPVYMLRVWEGGMSFHGGLIGVMVAALMFAQHHGKRFLQVTDFIVPLAPIGLAAGRTGNFINGELWGRTTDVPWSFVFPGGGPLPRHPSQLYEAGLEGAALFIILWLFSSRPRPLGSISGLFLFGYGLFRGFVEFFRQPDAHIGYLVGGWYTMGMLLSTPMILCGVGLVIWSYVRHGNVGTTGESKPTRKANK